MKLRTLERLSGGLLPLSLVLAGSVPAQDAQNMCVAPNAKAELNQCPEGAQQLRRGNNAPMARTVQGSARSHFRASERREEERRQGPRGPSIELDTASRMNRRNVQARAWNLIRSEVRLLKRMVGNYRKNDPKRPEVLLRLADTYFEMQQILEQRVRAFDEPIYRACRKERNREKCRKLRRQQKQAEAQLERLRKEAIQTYAILVRDHPNFPKMDQVLFALAFGLEQTGQVDQARRVYYRLIRNFPNSKFIPHAYLSFAEYFFNEGDMGGALKFYKKVVDVPPERNPVYGYALYKMAWAYYNQEAFKKSLEAFVRVIEFAESNPDANDAANLARQARRELVMPYAMVGTPRKALNFFRRYANDQEQALGMLERLAELYVDTGQWPKAIQVYHELMATAPQSDRLCYWQVQVTNAVLSSKPKKERVLEIKRLVDLYNTFKERGVAQERLKECAQETATILVTTATAWHREAAGTESQPGTNDRRTMLFAAALYKLLVENFPNLDQLEYPNIDRRDWPTLYKVSYYRAELLWKMEEWAKCGPAFDRVVELNPQGEYTADAAYAAVLCYNNLYQQEYSSRERQKRDEDSEDDFAPREFTPLEQGMLAAFQRYVCFVPDSDDLATIKYRRARIYYEARHWEEAAVLFRDIAFNHPNTELGVYAANLYLDSLAVLGEKVEPPRVACITEIEQNIEPLWGRYCNSAQKEERNAELCDVLQQLRCDVLRKKAEAYQKNKEWKKAAATYVRIYRRYRECGRLDEVLYNAAINFETAKLLGNAIRVRQVLIQEFPESELSKKAIYLLGANWHAIAVYDKAADYYEQFARRFPGENGRKCSEADKEAGLCPIAHEALMNAVLFRIGLGDEEKALAGAELFERNYGRRMQRQTAQVVFAIGAIYERQRNPLKIIDHYRRFLRRYGKRALPNQVLQANIKIARAFWGRDDREKAKPYLKEAVKYWTKKRAAQKILALSEVGQAQRILYLKEAIDAVAEALFHLAEFSYREFARIPFPRYKGRGTLASVNKWSQNEFKKWVEKKMAALAAAEKEYAKVAEVKVEVQGVEVQSPPWQIAAAARVGEMYRTFVDTFRDAPIPNEVKKNPELRDIYLGALDEQSQPLLEKAKGAFIFCLQTATNVRWFNEWSRKCEDQLNQIDPRRFPVAAELRGGAVYEFHTYAEPGPVELKTGDDAAELGGSAQQGGE